MSNIEQLKQLTGGWIPSPLDGTEYKYSAVTRNASQTENLPLSFRLWTSGIKNQVSVGSCVAHAVASMKETQDYYDTKATEEYSTSWIYLMRQINQYKGEGMYIKEAMANLKNIGVVPYSVLPGNISYEDGSRIISNSNNNTQMKEEASKHRISSYVMAKTEAEIKRAIYHDKSPVVIGVTVYESFYNTSSDGIVPIPNVSERIYGGHAMIITGWITIGNKDYWVVQNSWGEDWADNGYCYLEINKFPIDEMWASVDIADYPCNLTDINGRWSQEYVEKCVRAGLITGYEDNTFKPESFITREEFCTALWKMLDKVTK